jgi:iron complex transport system permease protein
LNNKKIALNKNKDILLILLSLSLIVILFSLNLFLGEVSIPISDIFTLLTGGEVENNSWSYIIESRLNRSVVAIFSGAALALSGIILQVYFRNPLAGPGVLGITSGASLGVAFIMLGGVGVVSFFGQIGVIAAGILGAVSVLFLLLLVSKFIHNAVTLLVIGLMFGYFTSAIIDVLFLWADLDETRAFVIWGMGSFEGLQTADLLLMCGIILAAILSSIFMIKPMNALVLVILLTGVLAAIVTVYCGPISFIGVAVPQLVRLIWSSKNHLIQIPATLILGAMLALLADLIVRVSGNSLPLNTVTALIGAPIIIYTIIKLNKKIA